MFKEKQRGKQEEDTRHQYRGPQLERSAEKKIVVSLPGLWPEKKRSNVLGKRILKKTEIGSASQVLSSTWEEGGKKRVVEVKCAVNNVRSL